MHSFAVSKKDNPKRTIVHPRDAAPAPNSAIALARLSLWRGDGCLNPLVKNGCTVGALAHFLKVGGGLHDKDPALEASDLHQHFLLK